MKVALVTTTINVPEVLKLYKAYAPWLDIYVAGDQKSPHDQIKQLDAMTVDGAYLDVQAQEALPFKTIKLLPWNCIQRRNVAVLAALRDGAHIIYTIDDDNSPLSPAVLDYVRRPFLGNFNGLRVQSASRPFPGWFDQGQLLSPPAKHRGFPWIVRSDPQFVPVTDVSVGVVVGTCLGDPDIDAVTRMAQAPIVHGVSELLRAGFVKDLYTWGVFNSQNTAYRRKYAPSMLLWPWVGRFDDIYASLVTQWVMSIDCDHVFYGQPFVWQQRNQHNLFRDLQQEIAGMERVLELQQFLIKRPLHTPHGIIGNLRRMYDALPDFLPTQIGDLGHAWLDDCESLGLK